MSAYLIAKMFNTKSHATRGEVTPRIQFVSWNDAKSGAAQLFTPLIWQEKRCLLNNGFVELVHINHIMQKFGIAVLNSARPKVRSLLVPRNVLPLIVFGLVLGCGLYLLEQNHEIRSNDEQLVVQQILATQESELSRRLSYMLSSTYFLAQEIARSHGEFKRFETYAASLLERMDGITNLQLAPGGIISRIYPLPGNEAAIGHDILKDDRRRDEAIEAVRDRKLTLAGPFELLQGGTAVIGRNPVFLSHTDGSEQFWGFTSALIRLEDLLSGSGLSALQSTNHVYELSRIIPETGMRSVFASSGDTAGIDMQSIEIVVPNGSWTLRLGLPEQRNQIALRLWQLGAFLIALLLAALTRRIADEPDKLRRRVAAQTQDLHRLAYFDSLTGLPNRHYFTEMLHSELEHIVQSKNGLALLLMDLDHFKEVNDTLGHDFGDILLRQAAERLSEIMPDEATLARLGGDEFTVVIIAPDFAATADQIAHDIINAIEQPFELQGNVVHVSASIGIASASKLKIKSNELLKCADQAMYEVKRSGRSGIKHYSETIQKQIATRTRLATDLRKAASAGELQLLYQPIISTNTGGVNKAEALLRWHHPNRGTICPSIFIPLAEEFGLIHELGDWVFNEAIRQARDWRQSYNNRFQISVNVSPLQFNSDGQIQRWIETAKATNLEPGTVLIEITEGLLLENDHKNIKLLSQLKEAGMQIALDDFGTGYSSLSYLKMLDIDYLKIDRSFIKGLTAKSGDLVVCEAILSIAQNMGFDVVAEGVETLDQEKLLCNIGCHYLQGFRYSKPIAAEEFEQLFFSSDSGKSLIDQAA